MKWSTLRLVGTLVALILALAAPAKAKPDCGLVGTYWRAVEIDGNPVTPQPEQREPHFVLSAEGNRVQGSTGCNRLAGSFEQGADGFRFQQMVTTKMACPPPVNALEQSFLRALNATTAARISGNSLELRDAAGQVRMRLQAR